MKQSTKSTINWWLGVAILVLAFATVEASGDRQEVEIGDTNVGGSDSLGLSSSMGDVDISDCLASKQISILIVWQNQWVVENPLCVAMSLDAIGAHEAAAKVRCQTDTISAAYPVESECILAVTAREREVIVPAPESDKDDEDYHNALEARLVAWETQRAKDAEVSKKALRAAQRAKTQPQAVQYGITDEQRAEIAEVFKK